MEHYAYLTKYILYLILILGFLWTNRIFVQNLELRRWLMQSFEDDTTGRASGKSLSAFICTTGLLVGWFISIHYGEDHVAPEYYFWGLLGLITSLYGIKEVGKVLNTKYTTGANGNNHQEPTEVKDKKTTDV